MTLNLSVYCAGTPSTIVSKVSDMAKNIHTYEGGYYITYHILRWKFGVEFILTNYENPPN